MSTRVLVTGGSGYIGGWAVAGLLAKGYAVRTTIRRPAAAEAVAAAVSSVVDPADRLEFATADLGDDAGWAEAMSGADAVLHVASPMGINNSGDLVRPAVDGTLRVLRAATDAGVRRVVMTSAANTASPTSYADDGVTDETLWTDPEAPGLLPYRRSKTLAEKAAWDFVATSDGAPELTTVLPGAVFGPLLSDQTIGSVSIIARMLTGKVPRVPRIGFEVVDVRDLVDLHIRALESPAAAGERFLGTGDFAWMRDIAQTLKDELGADAAKVSVKGVPDFVVRLMARRDRALAEIAPALGRRNRHSTAKAERMLGWSRRPVTETVAECGRSLLDLDVVQP